MKNDYISEIHEKDKLVLHPYEDLKFRGTYKRKLIVKSDNIYLYDEEGKQYIDGPGGMWCVNLGYGRKEIAQEIAEQCEKLSYFSPWFSTAEPSALLAKKLASLTPKDLNTVFFTTCGSTALDLSLIHI